ncbi:MAG: glycosyltransferase [Burkholderiales bacterium]|jgi:glycosyltransferase involved in cell wall biosynthesis
MADALRAWWGDGARPPVRVLGFAPTLPTVAMQTRRYDFIYVADGEAHKNHRRLLEAWSLLAEEGIRPSLALTLSERDSHLRNAIEATMRAQSLRIEFLPKLSHDEVLIAYAQSGALVFPSLTESYGLPLVEAASLGLPIIASERDFVREVCEPAQTFDPESPRSIARAVRRHLGLDAGPAHPATAAEFLRVVFP